MRLSTLIFLKIFFILGFTLPYLFLAISTPYLTYPSFILEGLSAFGFTAIPSFLGLLSLILYAGKLFLWSSGWYRDAFKVVFILLILSPSLFSIIFLFFMHDLLQVGINMYLAGVAVTILIAPWLILISQVEAIVKVKNTLALPAMGTFAAYGLIEFLVAAGTSGTTKVTDLTLLGSSLFQQLRAIIPSMVSSFSGTGRIGPLPDTIGGTVLGFEKIWIGPFFALTFALYFYYRLRNPKDDEPDQTRPERVFPGSFAGVGLTVLVAVSINFFILMVDNFFAISLQPLLDISLIATLIIVLIAIPKS